MRKKICLFTILLGIFMVLGLRTNKTTTLAETIVKDERELKAVWMSTFVGEAPYYNENQFKNSMNDSLDMFQYYGINAVIFHVRTHNNAFYKSELNPVCSWWSTANFEVFDPLTWLIEACHKRGIEFHAWMNPYRVDTSRQSGEVPACNPQNDPDNLLYGSTTILNPAKEVVRQHIINTISEFIELYPSVDAVHFDDYFYIANVDAEPYGADAKREEVNKLILGIHNVLSEFNATNNRAIQFGISPSGIYRNGDGEVQYDESGRPSSNGSLSSGFAHYGDYLYADTMLWAINGWIDYLMPQTYWATDHPAASYINLIEWWDKMFKYLDCNLYSGIGVYMANNSGTYSWRTNEYEMRDIFELLDTKEHIQGYSIYSYKHLKNGYTNSYEFSGTQINNAYEDPLRRRVRIHPVIRTQERMDVGPVLNVKHNDGTVTWDKVEDGKFYYVYYSETDITYSTDEIIGVVGHEEEVMSFDVSEYGIGNYAVRATSRTNHISPLLEENKVGVIYKNGDKFENKIIEKGTTAPLPEDPDRASTTFYYYEFLGWYLNDELYDFNLPVNETITLNAKWEEKHFTVNLTFHQGYDGLKETITILKGDIPLRPEDPERFGYIFRGWYFNDVLYNFSEPLMTNLTLVALWDLNSFNVVFDYGYGGLSDMVEVFEGEKLTKPVDPTKPGSNFLGWYLNDELYDFDLPVMEGFMLTAKWGLKNEVNVTFNYGYDNVKEIVRVLIGNVLNEPVEPTREGYNFFGWYLDDEPFDFNSEINDDITLYAKWGTSNEVKITFNYENYTKDSIINKNEKVLEPFTPHKDNYVFVGWYNNDELFDFDDEVLSSVTLVPKYEELSNLETVSIYKDSEIRDDKLVYHGVLNNSAIMFEHGFYLVYGRTNYEELMAKINEAGNNTFSINGKEVFKVIVKGTRSDGTYSVVLTGIPEAGYDDVITVVPYVVDSSRQIVLSKAFKLSSYNHAKGINTTSSKIVCMLDDLKRKDEEVFNE